MMTELNNGFKLSILHEEWGCEKTFWQMRLSLSLEFLGKCNLTEGAGSTYRNKSDITAGAGMVPYIQQ